MKESPDVSIIIVSWRVKDLLKLCLQSVYQNTGGYDIEVIVVDNNSNDGTLGMINEGFPDVKLIANSENRGFAKANNQGIKKSQSKYVLLLNPDTEINETTLPETINLMESQSDIGIAGCRMYYPNGSDQPSVRGFPTVGSMSLILLKIHHILPGLRTLKKYFGDDFDYSKTQAADQVMGAYFFLRREMIDQIGLLDESYYIWFEEVDYCYRAKQNSWKTYYCAEASIVHHYGQSFKQVLSLKKQKIFNHSLRTYARKYFSPAGQALVSVLVWPALLLSFIIQAFRR